MRGGEDDGTNELLDSLVQIAEESSQSQVTGVEAVVRRSEEGS